MPWRTISGGDRPAISTPSSRMWPESGLSAPVIKLKNVLFPAPLGPITAVSEPSAKLNVISSAALTPPNDFESALTSSMLAALHCAVAPRLVPFDREIHQALAQTDREKQDHDDAAGRGKQRRQHKDRQFGAPDVDPDESGAAGVVADHAQRVAERRLRDLPHQQKSDHQ